MATLLKAKANVVEAIRDVLVDQEQMTGDEFAALMSSLGEDRDPVAMSLRRPPRALGPAPAGNGKAAGGNGKATSRAKRSPRRQQL